MQNIHVTQGKRLLVVLRNTKTTYKNMDSDKKNIRLLCNCNQFIKKGYRLLEISCV